MQGIKQHAKELVRMGFLDVLRGTHGEIRRRCSVVSAYKY